MLSYMFMTRINHKTLCCNLFVVPPALDRTMSVANRPPPMKKLSNLKSEINENALGRIFPFIHACLCTSNWHKKPQKKVKLSYF